MKLRGRVVFRDIETGVCGPADTNPRAVTPASIDAAPTKGRRSNAAEFAKTRCASLSVAAQRIVLQTLYA